MTNNSSDDEIDFNQQNPPATGKGNRAHTRSEKIRQYDDQHAKNLAVSEKRKAARARNRQAKQLNNAQPPLPPQQNSFTNSAEITTAMPPTSATDSESAPVLPSTTSTTGMTGQQAQNSLLVPDAVPFNGHFGLATDGLYSFDFNVLNSNDSSLVNAAWDSAVAASSLGQSNGPLAHDEFDVHRSIIQDITAFDAPPLRAPTVSNDLITSRSAAQGPEPSRQLVPQTPDHRPQGTAMPSQLTDYPGTFTQPVLSSRWPIGTELDSRLHVRTPLSVPALPQEQFSANEMSVSNRNVIPASQVSGIKRGVNSTSSSDGNQQPNLATATSGNGATSVQNSTDERAGESLSITKKRTQHNESRKRMKRIAQVENRDKATVIETGYDFMRARIVTEYAYPDSKQEFAFAIGSYADAREALIERGFDMSDVPKTITYDESDLLLQRASQVRGDVRGVTRFVVPEYFKFAPCTSSDNITREQNRALYTTLITNRAFLYRNYTNITIPDTVFRSAAIEAIIYRSWFSNKHALGVTHREFFAEDGVLHNEVIALAATALRHGIDEWKEGLRLAGRGAKGVEFSQKSYHGHYKSILKMLRQWEDHTCKVSQDDSSVKYRKILFKNALIHAGVDDGELSDDGYESDYAEVFARNCGQSLLVGHFVVVLTGGSPQDTHQNEQPAEPVFAAARTRELRA
ncbi:hypothetical protein BC629DRAFT_1597859 [Irpex lacteus]|nr:hypothetical protein BC629DRAFT_1597859 [Irpex lacteus]